MSRLIYRGYIVDTRPVSNSYAPVSRFSARDSFNRKRAPMLVRLPSSTHRQTQTPAGPVLRLVADSPIAPANGATATWPERPDESVLSNSIPLFFISRDADGFWLACEADFRIGGVFLFRRSAERFAKRWSGPARCATMVLDEPHALGIENRGNCLVERIRPTKKLLTLGASKFGAFVTRAIAKLRGAAVYASRAYIERRMLHAALDIELYRGHYKHSNKNDDDLPIVTDFNTLRRLRQEQPATAGESVWPTIVGLAFLSVLMVAIVALNAMFWLPAHPPA